MNKSKIENWKAQFFKGDITLVKELNEYIARSSSKSSLQGFFMYVLDTTDNSNVQLLRKISAIILLNDETNRWRYYGMLIRNRMIELESKVSILKKITF